jgi:hypothetical protein
VEQSFSLQPNVSDWMVRRLTPRRLYPPKPKKQVSVIPSIRPKLIEVPDIEAIGVQVGKYQSHPCLLLQLAFQFPFKEECLAIAKKGNAQWNDTFNLWEIPLLSQDKKSAIYEAWDWLERLFFEHSWNFWDIPVYWNYGVSDNVLTKIQEQIGKLNNFWITGAIEYREVEPSLVYRGLTAEELALKTAKAIKAMYPGKTVFKWDIVSERSCVNYLRHKESAYHLLLLAQGLRVDGTTRTPERCSYQKIFKKVNEAIADAYPWLADECRRQIQLKGGK